MNLSTRRIAAAALALIMIAATFPASAATVIRQHYQKKVDLTCGVGCAAVFPKLAANHALDIDHVACDFSTTGDLADGALELLPASPSFSMPLGLNWQRSFGSADYFTLGGEMNVRVPLGGQARVVILVGGATYGSCTVTGTLLINT